MTAIRLLTIDDVPALAALYRENSEFLAPWEPARDEEYYTEDGYRAVVKSALGRYKQGSAYPCVILNEACAVAGRINLNDIVWGAFLSAHLGYWEPRLLGRPQR
jgi:ribosomal-protein-alanine N-acetyltransferase